MNPYEVLEISPGASADEIKAAYHQMAKLWHPDRFTGDAKPEAERRFRLLAEAFNMLKDTGRRESQESSPGTGASRGGSSGPSGAPAQPAPLPTASQQIQLDSGARAAPQTKTVEEWFQEAKTAMEAKAYDRALGLIQYAVRMDGDRAEFHALYGKLLDLTNGDKRMQVRTLETALRLNPRDVDTTILLAQTFQNLGMHARASRLWSVVHNLAPGHPVFGAAAKKAEGKAGKAKEKGETPTLGEQFSTLVADLKDQINKLFNRG